MSVRREILTKGAAAEKIIRLSLEIAERLAEENRPIVLVGIKKGGWIIGQKIKNQLQDYVQQPVELYSLLFENGDLARPFLDGKDIALDGKSIVLVDDVSNSGKTIFYALRPFWDSRPHSIQTLVMVERQHKAFPIKSDYVGLSLATTETDYIQVEVENGAIAGAFLENVD